MRTCTKHEHNIESNTTQSDPSQATGRYHQKRLTVVHYNMCFLLLLRLLDTPYVLRVRCFTGTHLLTLLYSRATGLTAGALRDLWASCRKLIVPCLRLVAENGQEKKRVLAKLSVVAPQRRGREAPTFRGHNSDEHDSQMFCRCAFMFIMSSSDPTLHLCCYAAHNVC